MKKVLLIFMSAAMLTSVGCRQAKKAEPLEKMVAALNEQLEAVANDLEMDQESRESRWNELIRETYLQHKDDSLGWFLFQSTIAVSEMPDSEVIAMFENASEMVREDTAIQKEIELRKASAATSAGDKYIDVEGPDALTGETLSISSVLAKGKPVLVDIWASWCGPCKSEIKNNLSRVFAEHKDKCNIIGIAVWEKSADDTRKAMEDLSIGWPVILGGDRVSRSIPDTYGVRFIPTMILIDTDGTILARSYTFDDIAPALGL